MTEYLDRAAIGEPVGALRVEPIYTTDAVAFVDEHHSHLDKPERIFYAAAVRDDLGLRCVACLARPKSRELQAQGYAEVVRVASDGWCADNAASMAVAALLRAARALGWKKFVSYTLLGEAGTIYRATGWWPVAITPPGREWNCETRPREAAQQAGSKVRWETYGMGVQTAMGCAWERLGKDASLPDRQAEAARLADVDHARAQAVGRVAIPPRVRKDSAPLFEESDR